MRKGGDFKGAVASVSAEKIETAIIKYLSALGQDPKLIDALMSDACILRSTTLAPLDKKINATQKELCEARELWQREKSAALSMDDQSYRNRLLKEAEPLNARVRELENALEDLKEERSLHNTKLENPELVASILSHFEKHINNAPTNLKRKLIQLLIEEILIQEVNTEEALKSDISLEIAPKVRTKVFSVNIKINGSRSCAEFFESPQKRFESHPEWLLGLGSNQRPIG